VRRGMGVWACGSVGVTLSHPCPVPSPPPPPLRRRGFTLLEVLVAMVILSIAMTVAWQTFSTATRAWIGGREQMETLHHGDFVLGRLTEALRSLASFETAPEKYAFTIEHNPTGCGEHTISWVTASSAFLPPNDPLARGLHRIAVGAGADDDGNEGLLVSAWPYLADEETVEKTSRLVSEEIKGLTCRAYDTTPGEEGWRDDWEDSNNVPGLVEITLCADSANERDDPVEFRKLIEIPLGPLVTNKVDSLR
jgi:prepilin-type N-terminal cleavage/methylation domain-containing protein